MAANCIFFSFWTKDEQASYGREDRLLNVNYLHGPYEWDNGSGHRIYTVTVWSRLITALQLHQNRRLVYRLGASTW